MAVGVSVAGWELHLDAAAIDGLLTAPGEVVHTFVTEVVDEIVARARIMAEPKHGRSGGKTGPHLADTIEGVITPTTDGVTAIIGSPLDYAEAVHEGSRPHKITARNAKALRWSGPSGPMFARSVNHPGSKPNPYLMTPMMEVLGGLG